MPSPSYHSNIDSAVARLRADLPKFAHLEVTLLGEGTDHLALDLGGRYVVRVPKREEAAAALLTEIRLLTWLAPRLPLAVPAYEFFPSGHDAPWTYGGYAKLLGTPGLMIEVERAPFIVIGPALGSFLRRLHDASAEEARVLGVEDDDDPLLEEWRRDALDDLSVALRRGYVSSDAGNLYLAAVASSQGQAVTIIDADSEHSACRWAAHAELPFEVIEGEPDRLARQVKAALNEGRTVIIDTPPNSRELLLRAGGLADIALVPVAPTGLEVDRLRPTLELLADLQAQRDELDVAVLLTRYNARRRLAREAEEALEGLPVLEARIREREVYKAAFGGVPTELDEYLAVWQEVQE